MKTLAIIMTVHNRKEKTLKCLESISRVMNIPPYDVIICDDASSDGTAEEVMKKYPDIIIVKGSGNCFWTRGMYLAMKEARKRDYDLYLMVNDDVQFSQEMWNIMNETLSERRNIGVTGATRSSLTEELTYSGAKFYHADGETYVGSKIMPNGRIDNECDVANWNCFLITKDVVNRVGIIDPVYEHSFGDFDYSLRMRTNGMRIFVSKEYIGFCENNSISGTYRDGNLSCYKRIKKVLAPTGLPFKSWSIFVNRYYNKNRIKNIFGPYVKMLIAILLRKDC